MEIAWIAIAGAAYVAIPAAWSLLVPDPRGARRRVGRWVLNLALWPGIAFVSLITWICRTRGILS